jgi:glycerol-1-phosphate dehydrogenase [NAD(P)+]
MSLTTHVSIPSLVRVKSGAIDRLGIYPKRSGHTPVIVLASAGLVPDYLDRVERSLADNGIACALTVAVEDTSFRHATQLFAELPRKIKAVVGLGGGKALDVAKYVAFLARLPYYATPTSLSNDGFSSLQSSLTVVGRRRSLAAALPYAVVRPADPTS